MKWKGMHQGSVAGSHFAWTLTTFGNPNNETSLNTENILHESLIGAVAVG